MNYSSLSLEVLVIFSSPQNRPGVFPLWPSPQTRQNKHVAMLLLCVSSSECREVAVAFSLLHTWTTRHNRHGKRLFYVRVLSHRNFTGWNSSLSVKISSCELEGIASIGIRMGNKWQQCSIWEHAGGVLCPLYSRNFMFFTSTYFTEFLLKTRNQNWKIS